MAPPTQPGKTVPKDAQLMAAILKDMGVTDYEPKVINQMLEFTYRYVTDILEEAKVYSYHANKKTVDCDDVALAVHTKMDNSFTTPPPRELLLELARHKNSQPLPLIKQGIGLRLPPDRFCFLSPNYRVKSQTGLSGSAPTQGSLPGAGRSISTSLQANAIQAALARKPSAKPVSGVGRGVPGSSFTSLQVPPGGVMMVRPGMQQPAGFAASMGVKRKLEDD